MTESLSARSRATILGLQKDLIAAVKGKDFPAALMLANRLLELEPGNELVRQIKPVVEEKIELDELQSVSGDEEEEGEEGEESSGEEGDSEDEEEEEEEKPKAAPKPKKEKAKKAEAVAVVDETLSDPVAEKLRQQKLVEAADLQTAKELFGDVASINLDEFVPKTEKDFEKYGGMLAAKYLKAYEKSSHFGALVKAIVKGATNGMPSSGVKEIEVGVAAIRNERLKAEKAEAKAAKDAAEKAKKSQKKTLSFGGQDQIKEESLFGGGGDNGYVDEDDYDFM
mmetsp:Transcript_2605/g.9530  ORF Transcript_2605/g.9530 Transcript_2605/m.9530 type:complete len:282 (+) Transcript_2605:3-848(+)